MHFFGAVVRAKVSAVPGSEEPSVINPAFSSSSRISMFILHPSLGVDAFSFPAV